MEQELWKTTALLMKSVLEMHSDPSHSELKKPHKYSIQTVSTSKNLRNLYCSFCGI